MRAPRLDGMTAAAYLAISTAIIPLPLRSRWRRPSRLLSRPCRFRTSRTCRRRRPPADAAPQLRRPRLPLRQRRLPPDRLQPPLHPRRRHRRRRRRKPPRRRRPTKPIADRLRDTFAAESRPPVRRQERSRRRSRNSTRPAILRRSGSSRVRRARGMKAAVARLKAADADGLDAKEYATPDLAALGSDPDALAQAELRLTASVIEFARHAQSGRTTPSRLSPNIDVDAAGARARQRAQDRSPMRPTRRQRSMRSIRRTKASACCVPSSSSCAARRTIRSCRSRPVRR